MEITEVLRKLKPRDERDPDVSLAADGAGHVLDLLAVPVRGTVAEVSHAVALVGRLLYVSLAARAPRASRGGRRRRELVWERTPASKTHRGEKAMRPQKRRWEGSFPDRQVSRISGDLESFLQGPSLRGERQFIQLGPSDRPGRVVFAHQRQEALAVCWLDEVHHLVDVGATSVTRPLGGCTDRCTCLTSFCVNEMTMLPIWIVSAINIPVGSS